MNAIVRFLGNRITLSLAVGFLAGAGVVLLSARFSSGKASDDPPKVADQAAHREEWWTAVEDLARDDGCRRQADFAKRFADYEIFYPAQPFGSNGPPLSVEKEKYLAVVLWEDDARRKARQPFPEPKNWSNPNFQISRHADGTARHNPDGGIRLELKPGVKPGTLTWSPRRTMDGSYSLKEDVSRPRFYTWYLLAAFSKSDGQCQWWCVFVN